jgi:hypothetical protein
MKFLIPLTAMFALAACNSSIEQKTDGSRVYDVGGTKISKTVAPANMPAYAPLYPGGKIIAAMENDPKVGPGGIVSFITQDKPAAAIAFYEKVATANKLTQKMGSPAQPDGSQADMLSDPDAPKRQLTVTVGPSFDPNEPGTKVGIAYSAP